jgi:hypothetical protein
LQIVEELATLLLHGCYRGGGLSSRSQILSEVDKLVSSSALHGSESLCKLLRYLANHALDHPGTPLKEYQIATEVFGRQSDFDPQLDSMVRVQAGRLRTKLAEHYSTAGASDAIWVELPKGTYVLAFHNGPPGGAKSHYNGAHEARSEGQPEAVKSVILPRGWVVAVAALSLLLAASLGVIAMLTWSHKTAPTTVVANEGVARAFPIFWKSFVAGPEEPLVIFSNAAFVGQPDVNMHYYDPAKDARAMIMDHYTGVGEVLAVHDLDAVFAALRQPIRVKRGSLFTLDDAKNNDLIFIGSPAENLALLEIPSTKEFTFRKIAAGIRQGNTEIINTHPRDGEPAEFLATPHNSQPLTEDYAVIALVPGMNPARSEMILAGTTTIGTQAAVEFVCSQNLLEELLRKLAVTAPGELKPFEAVIRVKVARGVPVESTIMALRSTGAGADAER